MRYEALGSPRLDHRKAGNRHLRQHGHDELLHPPLADLPRFPGIRREQPRIGATIGTGSSPFPLLLEGVHGDSHVVRQPLVLQFWRPDAVALDDLDGYAELV